MMKKMIVAMMIVASTATGLFASGAELSDGMPEPLAPTCTITIKGTYNGTAVDISVTVQADNCAKAAAEVLKAAIACK
jgi:hypothetical protein